MLLPRQNRNSSSAALLQLLLAIFVCSLPMFAGTHPVPLDKNTDSAKCLECHAEKGKGKAVHSAIAMGCTSCHEIRVNKDVTRVKLILPPSLGHAVAAGLGDVSEQHARNRNPT